MARPNYPALRLLTLVGALGLAACVLALVVATQEPADAAFPSQNGKIAFMSDRDGDFEIYTASPAGGNLKQLTNNSKDDLFPAWSPDGRKIAYSSGRRGTANSRDVFVMDADGSDKSRVTGERSMPGTLEGDDSAPAFSPDGRRIVCVRATRNNPEGDLYKIGADGRNPTRLTTLGYESPCCPVWSPGGFKIAYAVFDSGESSIETIETDGSGRKFFAYGSGPDWSPDGSQMVFGIYGEIHKIDADGTDEVRLTTGEAYDGSPAFSPDGKKIVFQRAPRDGNFVYDLHVMGAYGTDVRQLTNDPAQEVSPDWRPVR